MRIEETVYDENGDPISVYVHELPEDHPIAEALRSALDRAEGSHRSGRPIRIIPKEAKSDE